MGFLDGLFNTTVPELPIAEIVIDGDTSVEVGALYRIAVSGEPMTVALLAAGESENVRVALKVSQPSSMGFPGGELTVRAPEGQLIESDSGVFGTSVFYPEHHIGMYREWQCSDDRWLLVGDVL